jgi:hypothetical protein
MANHVGDQENQLLNGLGMKSSTSTSKLMGMGPRKWTCTCTKSHAYWLIAFTSSKMLTHPINFDSTAWIPRVKYEPIWEVSLLQFMNIF